MKLIEEIKSKQSYLLVSILFLISILYISDTGPSEIQPWDESMYIVRAKSILTQGNWLDQTNNSVGGLYSASHPPLFIWLTSISISLLGENHFSLRLFSVIFSVGILIIMFLFFREKKYGLLASFITSLIPIFYFYSHQAQMDIPVTFFMLFSVFLFNKYEENNSKKVIVMSGIVWGLAMMTKIAVGLIVPTSILIYSLILVYQKKKNIKTIINELLIFLVSGSIIFLPWHLYMIISNDNFLNYFLNFHILQRYSTGVENNVKSLGVFYYLNQAIVIFSGTLPFLYFSFKNGLRDKTIILLVSTAIVIFFVISLSATKMQTYIIMLIPFLSLIISKGLFEAWESDISNDKLKPEKIIFVIISICFSFWSFSQVFRDNFKLMISNFELSNSIIVYTLSAIIIIAILLYLTKRYGMKPIILFAVITLIISAYNNPRKAYYKTKIEQNAKEFYKDNLNSLVFIDSRSGSFTYNPQITYYFNGIDLGWQKNMKFSFIDIDSLEQKMNNSRNNIPDFSKSDKTLIIITSYAKNRIKNNRSLNQLLSDKYLFDKDFTYYYYKIKSEQ